MKPAELAAIDDGAYRRRLLGVLLLGACAALALTWFMHQLIHSGRQQLAESRRSHPVDFVRLEREEVSLRRDRRPVRPPPRTGAPPALAPGTASASASTSASVPAPDLALARVGPMATTVAVPAPALPGIPGVSIGIGGPRIEAGDEEYLPIVKIAPIYPYRAQAIGLEGECVVIYTVTATGATRDVRVLEQMCTDELFHAVSVEAARKFKYKPRVVDGRAVEVHEVTNRFIYRIPDELKR